MALTPIHELLDSALALLRRTDPESSEAATPLKRTILGGGKGADYRLGGLVLRADAGVQYGRRVVMGRGLEHGRHRLFSGQDGRLDAYTTAGALDPHTSKGRSRPFDLRTGTF